MDKRTKLDIIISTYRRAMQNVENTTSPEQQPPAVVDQSTDAGSQSLHLSPD